MSKDIHSLQGALAMALLAIGFALFLLGLAEWIEYRAFKKEFKKWKEKQNLDF